MEVTNYNGPYYTDSGRFPHPFPLWPVLSYVEPLEAELERARALDVADLADAIESIGFECTRCGACCKAETGEGSESEPHTATVQPDEVRRLQETGEKEYDWRDVARPMPFGIREGKNGPEGETFEWALQTDDCGDCAFYEESGGPEGHRNEDGAAVEDDGVGACSVHENRPMICETYPFSVVLASESASDSSDGSLGGISQPMGEAVDEAGMVRAHECEGLGRDISREDAEELADALRDRAVRELEAAIGVRENYEPANRDRGVVVHDSEGAKRPDGTPIE